MHLFYHLIIPQTLDVKYWLIGLLMNLVNNNVIENKSKQLKSNHDEWNEFNGLDQKKKKLIVYALFSRLPFNVYLYSLGFHQVSLKWLLRDYFEFFIIYMHFPGVGYQSLNSFLGRCHIYLILYELTSLTLLSMYLKEQAALPLFTDRFQ